MANLSRVVSELRKERERQLDGLRKLDNAIGVLQTLGRNTRGAGRVPAIRRRSLSAAARRRIAAAQRARWAKWKKQQRSAR